MNVLITSHADLSMTEDQKVVVGNGGFVFLSDAQKYLAVVRGNHNRKMWQSNVVSFLLTRATPHVFSVTIAVFLLRLAADYWACIVNSSIRKRKEL